MSMRMIVCDPCNQSIQPLKFLITFINVYCIKEDLLKFYKLQIVNLDVHVCVRHILIYNTF